MAGLTSHGIVMPHLKLGDITACVRLVVTDLTDGIDVIMGSSWLRAHSAKLDIDGHCCELTVNRVNYRLK